jgi:hypothetical protein
MTGNVNHGQCRPHLVINGIKLGNYKISLQTPFGKDLCRDLEFAKTFAAKGDPMQPCYPFTVFFFLQPRGCLSPRPCTKGAALDGSKLNHVYPSG